MKIRKLEGKERYDAYLIETYCFHARVEDVEAEKEKCEKKTDEDWGAFDEDGTLMARIINNHLNLYLDGTPIRVGGIGAVATLPEYRASGAIRRIFAELLPQAYQNGEVLSALYPFKHEFYRKQGYESVSSSNTYTLDPAHLGKYRFAGEVKKWNGEEDVTHYLEVYTAFASRFNLAKERSEEDMRSHMKCDKPYMDRKFSYLLHQEGRPVSYVIFTDVKQDPQPLLQVEECAWTDREGFEAILGFLARFEADYGKIKLTLPFGLDLLNIIQTPGVYEIEHTPGHHFMVRAVNAKELLKVIKKPEDCDFSIKVTDALIPENNGVFRVKTDDVSDAKEDAPDLELGVGTLGQLCVGAISLDEAALQKDVIIRANREMMKRCFQKKNIFVSEHF